MKPTTEEFDEDSYHHFDALINTTKEWFTCSQAATALGKSPQFIRNAIRSGLLNAHTQTMHQDGRKFYLIHRKNLILFLANTANYHPASFVKNIISLLKHCSDSEKQILLNKLCK